MTTVAAALAAAVDLPAGSRVLDVGGGSGVYAIGLVERFPGLRATVLESPPVDAIAARTIREAGLVPRIDVVAADMFAVAWPAGHDVHLFSNVLHDWDEPAERLVELAPSRDVQLVIPRLGEVIVPTRVERPTITAWRPAVGML